MRNFNEIQGNKKLKLLVIAAVILFCYLVLFKSKDINHASDSQITGKRIQEKQFNLRDALINDLPNLPNRFELGSLLEILGYKSMIEIGVHSGDFALETLKRWPSFEHYFGVDAWAELTNYKDTANAEKNEQDARYEATLHKLTGAYGKQKITLIRKFSTEAVRNFEDKSIDFVYVDARHDYCGCLEDIVNYYPKIRCGGLMAGHDFEYRSLNPLDDWGICANGTRIEGSVRKAVEDFAKKMDIKEIHHTLEGTWESWYFLRHC